MRSFAHHSYDNLRYGKHAEPSVRVAWGINRCGNGVKTKGGRFAHCFHYQKTCKIPKSYHDSPTGKLAGGSTILGHF